jgi:CRP/FNR family transcriptional regulator, nitrogen oxide reductase regulator
MDRSTKHAGMDARRKAIVRRASVPSKAHATTETPSVRLFSGLKKDESDSILAVATKRRFKARETIMSSGQVASHLFLVKTGSVNFYVVTDDGKEILLRRLVPGNVFGVATFLSEPTGYLGAAQAVDDSEVLMWDHRLVRQLVSAHPRLSENALRTVLRYLALYVKRHVGLVSNTAEERLAGVLTSLGSRAGHAHPAGVEVEIKNEDLASLADVGFFTASRLLKRWERKGAVEKSRGRVLIRCPEKLIA